MKNARDMTVAEIADSAYQGLLDLSKDESYGSPPDLSNPWHLNTLRFPGIKNGQQSESGGHCSYDQITYTVTNMSKNEKGRPDKSVMLKICEAIQLVIDSERFKENSQLAACENSLRTELEYMFLSCRQ